MCDHTGGPTHPPSLQHHWESDLQGSALMVSALGEEREQADGSLSLRAIQKIVTI